MSPSRSAFRAASETYSSQFVPLGLGPEPTRQLAVVTCMDSRIDVFAAFSLELGEAHVIRNAGGIVTDDVIRSLCVSQQSLGTTEVAIIQHTNCGLENLDEEALVADLENSTGSKPPWDIGAFSDIAKNVQKSIAALVASPFLAYDDAISGYVYDVHSGRLEEVATTAD